MIMFDAANLALFVAIARSKSFSGAARQLGLTTSTASRRLAELEETLGVRLLNRTTRSLSLTEAGQRYLEDVEPIVEAIEQANRHLTQSREEVMGRLRITAPMILGEHMVMDWILCFQKRFPLVRISLELENSFVNLPATGIDLAFRAGQLEDSSLIARHLMDDRPKLVASAQYLQMVGKPAHPKDLENLDAIITATDSQPVIWTFHNNQARFQFQPESRLRINDLGRTLQAVLAGHGISLLPGLLANPLLARSEIVELLPDWLAPARPIHLLYSSKRLLTLAQQAFIEFVMENRHPIGSGAKPQQ
jgi:DNA-binding transcriptional LysR family regulator